MLLYYFSVFQEVRNTGQNQKEIREKAFVEDNVMCKEKELSPGGTF